MDSATAEAASGLRASLAKIFLGGTRRRAQDKEDASGDDLTREYTIVERFECVVDSCSVDPDAAVDAEVDAEVDPEHTPAAITRAKGAVIRLDFDGDYATPEVKPTGAAASAGTATGQVLNKGGLAAGVGSVVTTPVRWAASTAGAAATHVTSLTAGLAGYLG